MITDLLGRRWAARIFRGGRLTKVKGVVASYAPCLGFAVVATLAMAPDVRAQDLNWSGAGDTAWDSTTNWAEATAPVGASDVVLDSASANQPVITGTTDSGSLTVNTVTVEQGQLTLQADGTSPTLTVTNGTTINGGEVAVRDASVLDSAVTVGAGGALTVEGSVTGLVSTSGTVTNSGTLAGGVTITGGTVSSSGTVSGTVAISNSATFRGTADTSIGALQVNGDATLSAAAGTTLTQTGSFYASGADTLTFGSITDTGTVKLRMDGGSLTSGLKFVVAAGTLQGTSTNFPLVLSLINGTTINSGATLDITGYNTPVKALSGSGTVTNSGAADQTLTLIGTSTFSGVIEDGATNAISVARNGTGTTTLGGVNTYTGATTVNGGTLAINATGSIQNTSGITVASGATLSVDGAGGDAINDSATIDNSGTFALTGSDETVGSIFGSGNIALNSNTLTTGDATDAEVSGVVSGSGDLVKQGSGALTLSGASTATGALVANAGTTVVSGSWAGDVENNATFDLTGTSTVGGTFTNTTTGAITNSTGGAALLTGLTDFISAGAIGSVPGSIAVSTQNMTYRDGHNEIGTVSFDVSDTITEERTAGPSWAGTGYTENFATAADGVFTTAGDFTTTGSLTHGSTAALTVSAGDTLTAGAITLNGATTVAAGANLTGTSFSNASTLDVAGGGALVATTGDFDNLGSGVVNFNDADAKTFDVQTGVVANSGTLSFNAGTTTVNSAGGAIQNTVTGDINIAAAATLDAGGDTITNAGSIDMLGAGSVLTVDTLTNTTGGVVNARGTLNADVVNQGSGDFNATGSLTGVGAFTNTGTATFDVSGTASVASLTNTTTSGSGTSIANFGTLYVNGAVENGVAEGTAASVITNDWNLIGGGAVTNHAGATLNSNALTSALFATALTNNGTMNLQGRVDVGSITNSGAGAVLNIVGNTYGGSSPTGSTPSTTPTGSLLNEGGATLNISGGELEVAGFTNSSAGSGTTLATAGVQVEASGILDASTIENTGSGTINNAGTMRATSVTNAADATLVSTGTISGNTQNSGTLNAAGTLAGSLSNTGAGTVTTSGDLAGITTLDQTSTGLITVSDGDTLEAQTITVAAGSGGIAVGAGSTLSGTGNTLNNNALIAVAAGGTLSDIGAINNLSGGVFDFAGGGYLSADTDATGDEDITNAGSITLGAGTLEVALGGAGAFINNYLLQLASGSAVTVDGRYANNGTTDMQNGTAGETVTVNGEYSGGGVLAIDVDFTADTSDRLLVNGDVTGDQTSVAVADVSTGGASGNPVVIASVSGTAAADAFTLSTPLSFGALVYEISQSGADFVLAGTGGFVAEVTGLEALPYAMLQQSRLPSLRERSGTDQLGVPTELQSAWFLVDGGTSEFAPAFSGSGFQAEMDQARIRGGLNFDAHTSDTGHLVLGVNLGYGSARSTISSDVATARIDTDARSLGLTATWFGNSGFYVDGQLQYTDFSSDMTSAGFASAISGEGVSSELEIGQRFRMANSPWSLTPRGRLKYSTVSYDPFTSGGGLATSLDTAESLQLGMGLVAERQTASRAGGQDQGPTLYGSADIFRELAGDITTIVAGTPVVSAAEDWSGEIGLGLQHRFDNGRGTINGELTYVTGFDNPGRNNALSVAISGRIAF
ncbi:beta strand repeat-containing protein [Sedimentimonas flavescens]|uniref:beta strand repeat-containing protein n=1 Tax=Sedimentimonas flavescens TaxID=2851012 RepID=UPI0021A539A2|nr:autotransporter outer membrane beta-barrel domain-containing protein [Sedimentimonas flavescens]MCT2538724.1 autotransporter outer membrane beta-barrel domain-containing protein [Sedimentimonas flavescens]